LARSRRHDRPDIFSRSAAITPADRPQPTTSGRLVALEGALLDRMYTDGQRLGQRGVLGRQSIGHFSNNGAARSICSHSADIVFE